MARPSRAAEATTERGMRAMIRSKTCSKWSAHAPRMRLQLGDAGLIESVDDVTTGHPLLDPVEPLLDLRVHRVELLVHVRDLHLGLEVHVVLDVAAHLVACHLPVLTEEHEHAEDDRLEGDHEREEAERERVEVAERARASR